MCLVMSAQTAGPQLHGQATNFNKSALKVLPVLPSSTFRQMLVSFIYIWVDPVPPQNCCSQTQLGKLGGKKGYEDILNESLKAAQRI